jgi:hypothetical protein
MAGAAGGWDDAHPSPPSMTLLKVSVILVRMMKSGCPLIECRGTACINVLLLSVLHGSRDQQPQWSTDADPRSTMSA